MPKYLTYADIKTTVRLLLNYLANDFPNVLSPTIEQKILQQIANNNTPMAITPEQAAQLFRQITSLDILAQPYQGKVLLKENIDKASCLLARD